MKHYYVKGIDGAECCICVPNSELLEIELALCFTTRDEIKRLFDDRGNLKRLGYKRIEDIVLVESIDERYHELFNSKNDKWNGDEHNSLRDKADSVPEDWYERCDASFLNMTWRSSLSTYDDLYKFINCEEIDSVESVINCVFHFMFLSDPHNYEKCFKAYLWDELKGNDKTEEELVELIKNMLPSEIIVPEYLKDEEQDIFNSHVAVWVDFYISKLCKLEPEMSVEMFGEDSVYERLLEEVEKRFVYYSGIDWSER